MFTKCKDEIKETEDPEIKLHCYKLFKEAKKEINITFPSLSGAKVTSKNYIDALLLGIETNDKKVNNKYIIERLLSEGMNLLPEIFILKGVEETSLATTCKGLNIIYR